MAIDFSGSSSSSATASGVLSAGKTALYLIVLRLFGGLTMIYFQGWGQAVRAWRHVWEKKPWALVSDMAEKGYPSPTILASVLIFLLLCSSFGILIGFITRINAILMLTCTIFLLLTGLLDQFFIPQLLVIYAGIYLALVISGPGLVSFDALLTRRRQQKKGVPY